MNKLNTRRSNKPTTKVRHCDFVYSVDGKIHCDEKSTHRVTLESGHNVFLCKFHASNTTLGNPVCL